MLVIGIDGNMYTREKGEDSNDVVVYMEGLNKNVASNVRSTQVDEYRKAT